MSDIVMKRIGECDYYQGEGAIQGIKFRSVGRQLGVSAWGMNVLEIAPECRDYPEHDHVQDGQEEVYVILDGSATLVTPQGETLVEEGTVLRVGPGTRRKFLPGEQGVTLLAIGGTPGKAYEARR